MRLIDDLALDPEEGAAADAALFRAAEVETPCRAAEQGEGRETLRFWESAQPAVVVGRSGVTSREVREAACRADRVPIVRRESGGGAVVVGPGCLNYALVLSLDARPELRDVSRSYRVILDILVRALALPEVAMRGAGDVALGERKVSGSAQRRGRRWLLHHGTLLYRFDVRLLDRYLRDPVRQPAYRAGRGHAQFVTNLPLPAVELKTRIARAFGAGG